MKYIIGCGSGIGDLIIILPMAKAIKQVDKQAYIKVFIAADTNRLKINKALLDIQDYIDTIDCYSLREPLHLVSFISKIGYKTFDYGFVLQYDNNFYTSTWPSRIVSTASKKTCGISTSMNPEIVYDITIPRQDGMLMANYGLKMLHYLGISSSFDTNNLINKNKLLPYIKKWQNLNFHNKNSVVLCLSAAAVEVTKNRQRFSKSLKNWSYDNWQRLALKLVSAGFEVILIGGKKERREFDISLNYILSENIHDYIGKLSVIESIAVMSLSKLVVGADTGMMHCAGAIDIPSLTLFGCTDPKEYLAFGNRSSFIMSKIDCAPCFGTEKAVLCCDIKCMKEITVDEVYEKIVGLIKDEN